MLQVMLHVLGDLSAFDRSPERISKDLGKENEDDQNTLYKILKEPIRIFGKRMAFQDIGHIWWLEKLCNLA